MNPMYDPNLYYVPSEDEVKADLYSFISDASKDAYGSRYRFDYREMSVAELEAMAERMSRAVSRAIEEERAAELRARARFEKSVDVAMAAGAADRATAVRWLLDAEGFSEVDRMYGDGYVNYSFGVGYDYNLLTGEVDDCMKYNSSFNYSTAEL